MEILMDNKNYKSGFVAIVGRPNVGKSTLMNQIIGQKIAITSDRPQTTRNKIRTIYSSEEGQIVFVDTPGIHMAKTKLGEYMVSAAKSSFADADCVLWIVEASDYVGGGDKAISEILKTVNLPIILVINKIDTINKDDILKIIDAYKSECDFAEIIPVSALKGKNTDELVKCIYKYLPYGEPYYDEDSVTDIPQREIVAEIIREKALRNLKDEIPHGVAVTTESMKFAKNICNIEATLYCERDSHKGIIIGKGGEMLRKIGSAARRDIEEMVEMQVNLKIWVKVKPEWRDSDFLLKNFGYDKKDI